MSSHIKIPTVDRLTPVQEKEWLFQTELVKACVPHHQAVKAARIIATKQSDEQLTTEDLQMINQVCRQWLEQRKRRELISQTVGKTPSQWG